MSDKAPFIITHHDDASSWQDSPLLNSLVQMRVVVTDRDGSIYEGFVSAVNHDGTITVVSDSNESAWISVTLRTTYITSIHYC